MKRQSQAGFAIVELALVVVVLAALGGIGYYVWHSHKASNNTTTTMTSSSSYHSPPVTTPTAPQVSSASDLNSAMQALNETNIAASNTDSNQLSTQASTF